MMASLVRPIAVTRSGWGGERRRAEALDQALQRKLELVRLVQRDLEDAGRPARRREALRRRVDDRQAIRIEAAIRAVDQRGRRWAAALDHQRRSGGAVAVVELLEQRFAARGARAGPDPSAKKASLPSPPERRQPAYWQARQAVTGLDRRTTSVQGQRGVDALSASVTVPGRPCRFGRAASQRRCCRALRFRVDQGLAELAAGDGDPELGRRLLDPLDELRRALVHVQSRRRAHARLALVVARIIAALRCASACALAALAAQPKTQCTRDRPWQRSCQRLGDRRSTPANRARNAATSRSA